MSIYVQTRLGRDTDRGLVNQHFHVRASLQGIVDQQLLVNSATAFAPIAGAKSEKSLSGDTSVWDTAGQRRGSSKCNQVVFAVFGRNSLTAFMQGIVDQLLLVNLTVAFAPIAGAETVFSLCSRSEERRVGKEC